LLFVLGVQTVHHENATVKIGKDVGWHIDLPFLNLGPDQQIATLNEYASTLLKTFVMTGKFDDFRLA
jgi:hypothetical protein